MDTNTAKKLFDLQQVVIDQCLNFHCATDNNTIKNQLLEVAAKSVDIQTYLLQFIPRD